MKICSKLNLVRSAILSACAISSIPVQAVEFLGGEWSGYVRQHLALSVDDPSDQAPGVPTSRVAESDNKGDLTMARSTLLIQGVGNVDDLFSWTVIARGSYEYETDYLNDLNNNYVDSVPILNAGANLTEQYEQTTSGSDQRWEFREAYVDFSTGSIDWRIGKQQVIWGETDVFHPNDVIHGFNFAWHSVFEPENEEVRKPLLLINAIWDLSEELDGSLQLIYRPGWDAKEAIGNTYDFQGGRWAQNGARGANYTGLVPIDYKHKDGDYQDANYGFRWDGNTGEDGDITYSFSYYHGLALDPVIVSLLDDPEQTANSSLNIGIGANGPDGTGSNEYGLVSDVFVYQMVDTFGASLSGYLEATDAVYRVEVSYTPDRWFGNLNNPVQMSDIFAANYGRVEEFDVTTITFGYDTNARLMNVIGTSSPGLLSFQIFDTHINGYSKGTPCKSGGVVAPVNCAGGSGDALVNAFGGVHEEDTWIGTVKFTMPYMNDTLIYDLTALWDFTDGGTMFLPSIEKHIGAHWRLRLEGNLFFGGNKGDAFINSSQVGSDGASLIGSFDKASQVVARITYQF